MKCRLKSTPNPTHLRFRVLQTQDTLHTALALMKEGRSDLAASFIDGALRLIDRDLRAR